MGYTAFQIGIFVLLSLQNSSQMILSSYTQQREGHVKFIPEHYLLFVEGVKLLGSLFWCAFNVRNERRQLLGSKAPLLATVVHVKGKSKRSFWSDYFEALGCNSKLSTIKEVFLMAVPSVIYAAQNFLILCALRCIDPVLFQLTYQIRLLFTAVVMSLALGTLFSRRKKVALVVLLAGVYASQYGSTNTAQKVLSTITPIEARPLEEHSLAATPARTAAGTSDAVLGVLAALGACSLSAISSVYMEFVFKKRTTFTLSARNVHLASFSVANFVLLALFEWSASSLTIGKYVELFTVGFDTLVWLLVLIQALGGILVALIMCYLDNIMKSFSIAASLIISGVASIALFNLAPSAPLGIGALLVVYSTYMYNTG